MPKDISIVQNEHPDEGETDFIYQQLRIFNTLHTGKLPRKSIRLFAYNPEGRVVGGLFGDVGWGWLHIDILWVDASYQGQGIATDLLKEAEVESVAIGVDRAYLETTAFQARPFYEKMGYEVFAQLEDQPPGHTCYYMKKLLG